MLGVLLVPVRPTETNRLARARALEILKDDTIIFEMVIRENGKIADDCRDLGIVATEYEERCEQARVERVSWYKRSKADREKPVCSCNCRSDCRHRPGK